ncbi:MAG: DUF5615 family PIN-like protein [Thermomicrobia bacterium]|nr:DUF5615 family PIN-like protein [Thermomicrobia bacterium]MCA1725051.1 DUF5615 family PIN-like protein [Thermomicrobia bacterium]
MPRHVIYLDECVDHDIIPFLQARGAHIETAQGHGQRTIGDDEHLRFTAARGWVILSTNPDHFRHAHRRAAREGWTHAGIITLAPEATHQPRFFLRCAMLIDWMERAFPDARNHLLRWSDLQMQLQHGGGLPGYDADDIAYASGQTITPPLQLMAVIRALPTK